MFQLITHRVLLLFSEIIEGDGECETLPDLLAAEREIELWVRRCGLEMLRAYLAIRLKQAKALRAQCKCGKPIPLHKESRWPRHSKLGTVEVTDPYCYCKTCGAQDRPLHRLLGTERESWSLDTEKMAVDLSADESCEKAVKKLERMHPGVQMGRTTALRALHKHGESARAFIRAKMGQALIEARTKAEQTGGIAQLEVEYDEGMIPTAVLKPVALEPGQAAERTAVRGLPKRKRVCDWKGAKVGLVQVPGETARLYTARPTHELNEVFQDLLGLAVMKGWAGDTQVRGIADGAPYIRKRMEQTFEASPFKFILDWPHGKGHVYAAAERLHPFDEERRKAWVARTMQDFDRGNAQEVVDGLRRLASSRDDDELRKAADYFDRNKDAVAYAEYREKGWSTASSEVESSHRHVVQVRLKIPGAWWHPDKVGNILALRVLKSNPGWWDEYWASQDQQWKRRALSYRQTKRKAA